MTQLAATLITLFERSRLANEPKEYPVAGSITVRVRYDPGGHRQLIAWRPNGQDIGELEISKLAHDGGLGDDCTHETKARQGITYHVLTATTPEEIQP